MIGSPAWLGGQVTSLPICSGPDLNHEPLIAATPSHGEAWAALRQSTVAAVPTSRRRCATHVLLVHAAGFLMRILFR